MSFFQGTPILRSSRPIDDGGGWALANERMQLDGGG